MKSATLSLLALPLSLAPASLACVGTTGSDLVSFDGAAAGPEDATAGAPLSFSTGRGYQVVLDRAKVHIGAVYLNRAYPTSGAQATSCVLPGTYVAELTHGLTVDALSPSPQPFPEAGEALAEPALAGEVWLTGGDVDSLADDPVILDLAGTATKGEVAYPFEAALTIGANRVVPTADPSQPGANPICKERIVSPIAVSLTPRQGGRLLLRVDPRGFVANVDFAALPRVSDDPPLYRFEDRSVGQPSVNLYAGLKATSGVYRFQWIE